MTTRTYISTFEHADDAGFRAWASELSSNLQAAGLVKTVDTGQINFTTVLRPTVVNTASGYEIYHLPDSSLFFKLEYGTAGVLATPGMWMTVGEGSDGTGNLTGSKSARATLGITGTQPTITSTTTAYNTYICVTADFFGFIWKASGFSMSSNTGFHGSASMVMKTVDGNGIATGLGYAFLSYPPDVTTINSTGNYQMQCVRRTGNARVVTTTRSYSLNVGSLASNVLDDGTEQVYTCFGAFPEVLPLLHICTVFTTEMPFGTQFSVAMVGPTAHNYAVFNEPTRGNVSFISPQTLWSPSMLWE